MDGGKLKNIVLLILLLLNLTFGILLIAQKSEKANQKAQTKEDIVSVMKHLGITIKAESIPEDADLWTYSFLRDTEKEASIAASFLGETKLYDRGGSIYEYQSASGRAVFRNGGSIELQINSAVGNLERKLENSGIDCKRSSDRYCCSYNGLPVFNCSLSLSSSDGGITLSGQCIIGTQMKADKTENPGQAAILLRFREQMLERGNIFTEIRGIEPGYVLTSSANLQELIPFWKITTDGGNWLFAPDGTLEQTE